jgi:NAD-dependent SIR2 family protein deacetylase
VELRSTLRELVPLLRGKRVAVLTGAGISTESGIPDYRGPETRRRARHPIRFKEYVASPEGRARYWARSMVGWERFSRARPNGAHLALAALESAGHVAGIVTQNVDRLHHAAGSVRVVELHGALAEVRCLECGAMEPRARLQERLVALNPTLLASNAALAPDGDADLPDADLAGFRVAACGACGGPLKPHVVFFGESVAREIVEQGHALVDACEALLVVGSSLAVFSGFRFVKRAHDRGIPIAIANVGETRGDALATMRIDERAGAVLPALAEQLCDAGRHAPRTGLP